MLFIITNNNNQFYYILLYFNDVNNINIHTVYNYNMYKTFFKNIYEFFLNIYDFISFKKKDNDNYDNEEETLYLNKSIER